MASGGHGMASLAPVNVPKDAQAVTVGGSCAYEWRGSVQSEEVPAQYSHLLCSCIPNRTVSTVPHADRTTSCHKSD